MDKYKLIKANELNQDIELMSEIIHGKRKEGYWLTINTPIIESRFFSDRFENELIEWMDKKVKEYKTEFENL